MTRPSGPGEGSLLNNLSPAALRAAMRGGTSSWGRWASATEHVRYMEPITGDKRRRRKCRCGCEKRQTHVGKANGMALMGGCEMAVARWVKDPFWDLRARAALRAPQKGEG